MKCCLLFVFTLSFAVNCMAFNLTKNGQPVAEIVVSADAQSSVKTAAQELQKYIKKMSGAELKIVSQPGRLPPVYIGKSKFTDDLGIKIDDIKFDGFKIIVNDKYAAIVGVDMDRPPIPRCNTTFDAISSKRAIKEWQKETGKKWGFHMIHTRDPRFYRFKNKSNPLSFHTHDANGTLYGVYELLEELGCRFFMPIEEIGFVIPKNKNLTLVSRDVKFEPSFEIREEGAVFPQTDIEFLWLKQLRQGGKSDLQVHHSSSDISAFSLNDPEMVILKNGKPITIGATHPIPRLASEKLRREHVEYILKMHQLYPELQVFQIGQPDGWITLDDRDKEWDKEAARGSEGRFSDYLWDFVMDVAARTHKIDSSLRFSTFVYGCCRSTPTKPEVIPANIDIIYTQSSSLWNGKNDVSFKQRQEWEKKAPNSRFVIYDYYLSHSHSGVPAIPVIFTKQLKKNLSTTSDRYRAVFVEIAPDLSRNPATRIKFPGLNHLMYYLHGKLTWNKHADVNAILEDYYTNFFGPAAAEMREFYEFAEKVWSRPESRKISAYSGFLKKEDIPVYFEILDRAEKKAGKGTIYEKRIQFIRQEMAPVKKLFVALQKTGPSIRVRSVPQEKNVVDGDLTKSLWTKWFPGESFSLKDNMTGEKLGVNGGNVALRWADNALYIGITCHERKMNKLHLSAEKVNDDLIWNDDFVEIQLETPEGYDIKLAVNPNGIMWCRGETPDVAAVASVWRPDACMVRKLDNKWTVEIRISGVGARPTKIMPWGFNVCRQRLAGNVPDFSALSPTGGSFTKPEKMATIFVW